MAMGECSVYSSIQVDSKVKLAAWPTSWWPPGADRLVLRRTKVKSHTHMGCSVYDSTINIILGIIIIIIL